jgi:transposase InsO family protein
LRRPIDSAQYTSQDYTQVLDDHRVLASVGSVGDAYDNAMAESFVDSYKTELIADRVWRTHAQLEIATVEYIGWFNHARLHSSLGNVPPAEYEANYQAAVELQSGLLSAQAARPLTLFELPAPASPTGG